MKITLKLYATLSDYLPPEARSTNQLALDLDPATTVAEIADRYRLPRHLVHLVLVNGLYIPPADRLVRTLEEGDTLAIWPPIAGG